MVQALKLESRCTFENCIRQFNQNQYTPSAGIGLERQSPAPQSERHFQTMPFSRFAISPARAGMGGRSRVKHFPISSGIRLQSTTNKLRLNSYKLTYNSTPFIVYGGKSTSPYLPFQGATCGGLDIWAVQ